MYSQHTNEHQEEISKAERDAMRAYLARGEVRFSTMHRIGIGFINGAGLLLLLPIFFKDVIVLIIGVFLDSAVNYFPDSGSTGLALSVFIFITLLYPFLLSVTIPIYAVYLLLKDILHFYFTVFSPGFPNTLNNPTFTLTGLAFPSDEGENAKRLIMKSQYESNLSDFAMPFSERRKEAYFDELIRDTNGEVIPSTRTVDKLEALGVLNGLDRKDVDRFNAQMGLARMLDRTLAEEVAIMETGLARNVLYLRRLVLRYVKTLLVFIWTMLTSFFMVPFLDDERFPDLVVLAVTYTIWSTLALHVIHLPFHWLYRFNRDLHNTAHMDRQIILLESRVRKWVYGAVASSFTALFLTIWMQVR